MPCSLDSLLDVAKRLRLTPMIRYAMELEQDVTTANLSHAEYLAKLLHCECERRDEEALKRRLQQANFRYADACIARVDWNADRQINRSLLDTLASNDYIRFHQNVIITGATGCGKTWLADALGHTACLAGFRVKHYRVAQMLKEYEHLCTENTSVGRRQYLSSLGKLDLLILDDWGIGQLDDDKRFSLYEIIENHMQHGSFIVTSVLPVKQWNEYLNDALMADSILDRLVLNSHRLVLQGNSMRSRPEYGGLPKNDTEVQRLI